MGKKETNSYILKDIPPELWKQFRHRLLDDNLNIKDGLIMLVTAYINDRIANEEINWYD